MWRWVLLPALAMCLGWGIRGQFGGETGAMVPGALVGLTLAVLSGWKGRDAARLGAVGAFACSLGGMMTYGQTIGLVQDQYPSPTYWWGLLGLAIKGGVWIGITGIFLAIACSEQYRPAEMAAVLVGAAEVNHQPFTKHYEASLGDPLLCSGWRFRLTTAQLPGWSNTQDSYQKPVFLSDAVKKPVSLV